MNLLFSHFDFIQAKGENTKTSMELTSNRNESDSFAFKRSLNPKEYHAYFISGILINHLCYKAKNLEYCKEGGEVIIHNCRLLRRQKVWIFKKHLTLHGNKYIHTLTVV